MSGSAVSRTLGAVSSDGRKQPEVETTFGVSGYLMESDVLLWDRVTQTLWSQIDGKGIAGPRSGYELARIPVTDTTWGAWKAKYPGTRVLEGAGARGGYGRSPYARYHKSDRVMFPVTNKSDRLPDKSIVSGVRLGDHAACWSHDELAKRVAARKGDAAKEPLVWKAKVGEAELTVSFDPVGDSIRVAERGADGEPVAVPSMRLYWFAWFTFHPRTTVDATLPDTAAD